MSKLPPLPNLPTSKDVPPVEFPKNTGELTENESTFILDSTLTNVYRQDPNILAFIDCFIRCKNIAQASDECGIDYSLGYRIRHYKTVSLAIQKLIDKSSIKYGFDSSEIMERTKELVDFDPIMLMNQDGTYKSNMHDIPPEARRSLKSLKVKNLYTNDEDINGIKKKIIVGELIEYQFYDKLKAIELSGKEKDMFKNTTVTEYTVSKDMRSLLLESANRGNEASKGFVTLNSDGERS